MRNAPYPLASTVIALAVVAQPAHSQPRRPPPAPMLAPPAAPLPPVVTAPPPTPTEVSPTGEPLSLAEAVATTLRLHPNIKTARAELAQRRAEIGAAHGPFDPL
ncbi:MAG TPA: hypothetical protein VHU80_16130, partial [Polyangiaceae bacterium]|nr:hypothetical protein [Polyangiaceae bacterium]